MDDAEGDAALRHVREDGREEVDLVLGEGAGRIVGHRTMREDAFAVEMRKTLHLADDARGVRREDTEAAHAGIELEVDLRRCLQFLRGGADALRRGEVHNRQDDARLDHRLDLIAVDLNADGSLVVENVEFRTRFPCVPNQSVG